MTTYSNLKYNHPLSANATGTGSLVLISSQTASGSSSLSFTSGIDSTYKEYVFKFINIHPSANSDFAFNMSIDGGSNYNATKTTTFFNAYHYEDGSASALAYQTGDDLAQGTGYQVLMAFGDLGINADDSLSGHLHLFEPSSTTFVKHFISTTVSVNNEAAPYINNDFIAGYGNTTSAVNALDFKMLSGNIDSGVIKLYGIN
tara:strand:- start:141 stop:746 length:606 start_codon:yes stop_codon:yes gene_type:complete